MILLAGVTLNPNLYLSGVTQAKVVTYRQQRTIEGESIITIVPTPGGRQLALKTTNVNGARQGVWCQSVIDQIKDIAATGSSVVLNYYGDIYLVKIVDTSNLTQLHQYEPVNPNKQYIGSILTIEV